MEQTFRLKSPSIGLLIRRYEPADLTLLNFQNANPLEMGEWCTISSANKVTRAANPGVRPGPYVLFSEKGRSDVQGARKVPLIMGGTFLGETKIFDAAAPPALGNQLDAATVTWNALSKSGLKIHAAGVTVGYVIRTAASNGDWLQFLYVAS
jgi:hypothetical protein